MLRVVMFFWLFATAGVAEIMGERDAAFTAARGTWLSGQGDLAALQAFAGLASEGNVAA